MPEGYNNFEPRAPSQQAMTTTAVAATAFDHAYRQQATKTEAYHVPLHQSASAGGYAPTSAPMAMRNGDLAGAASPVQQQHSPASSTTSSGSGNAARSEPPKRLRYWLIDMIEGGTIPGLQWENREKTVFRIPWKHAGKNNWREEDCQIFKEWAKHRGKWKHGDKLDAATWKTRLRCALNKLPDIKELKEHSNLEGNDPYRVYQLLPEPDKSQEAEIWPRSTWGKESSPPNHHANHHMDAYYPRRSSSDLVLTSPPHPGMPRDVIVTSEPPRPLTGDPTQAFSRMKVEDSYGLDVAPPPRYVEIPQAHHYPRKVSADSTGYDAQGLPQGQPLPPYKAPNFTGVASPAGSDVVASPGANMDADGFENFRNGIDQSVIDTVSSLPDNCPPAHEMEIYIRYRGSNVIACHVVEDKGCRIHYGDANLQHIASETHGLPSGVFGSVSLRQIELVECEPYAASEKQVQLTRHVLNNIRRGLILYYNREDGCFYAKRLCQSRVFVLGPESPPCEPEKLDRNQPLKVFDYKKFCEKLRRFYHENRHKPPEFEVFASFGQNWSMRTPIEKNLVTLYMIPRAARYLLLKMRERRDFQSLNDSLLSSGPDSYDRLAERATNASVSWVDEILKTFSDQGDQFAHLFNSPGPQAPEVAQAASTQPHVTPYQTGFFQQNVLNPAPIEPLNDVEMDVNGM